MHSQSDVYVLICKLAKRKVTSRNFYQLAQKTILTAFDNSDHLFSNETEKNSAGILLEESLSKLNRFFAILSASLDPDFRELAQRCRSGLQYLIDEFADKPEVYSKFEILLESAAVESVEDFIDDSEDSPPEHPLYSLSVSKERREQIPLSHFWWDYAFTWSEDKTRVERVCRQATKDLL